MGCQGCPEKPHNTNRDRLGNIKDTESDMDKYEQKLSHSDGPAQDITYDDYIRIKKERREEVVKRGEVEINKLTKDQRKITVSELVSIYNHDELGRMTPTQALVALKELMQFKAYKDTIMEFEGLEEQIEGKYKELMENKIKIK